MKEEDCVWPKPSEQSQSTIPKVKTRKPKMIVEKPDNITDHVVVKRGRKPKVSQHETHETHETQKNDYKLYIVESLEKLRKKELANKQPFKARAYNIVLQQLKTFKDPIRSLDDLKNIKGIGQKIQDKLKEIFETGALRQVQEYDSNSSMQIFEDLTKIHGIGPTKARELITKHQIKNINELSEKQELLNDVQKKGLKYYIDFQKRIPRTEMLKHEEYIFNVIRTFGSEIQASLSGSFRRVEPTSGDIDVLITKCDDDTFKKIITKLETDGYLTDIFALGNKKCMAVGKLKRHKTYRRVDFMLTAEHEYPFALLYFTGSGTFNVAMRNWALSKGYSLSEYGLKYHKGPHDGKFVDHDFKDEADIFKFIGLKYVEPKNRKDGNDLKDSQ